MFDIGCIVVMLVVVMAEVLKFITIGLVLSLLPMVMRVVHVVVMVGVAVFKFLVTVVVMIINHSA